MPKMAVVGAGIVGMSTAINILKQLPSAEVTIVADNFDKETTSHGVGGLFRPNVDHLLGVHPDRVTRWSVDGFKFYSSLALSPESGDTGHMVMPGYVFSNTEIQGAPVVSEWVDLRPHREPFRVEKETMKFPKGSLKVVHYYGHGALGITLAWGTSIDATKLVLEDLKNLTSKL